MNKLLRPNAGIPSAISPDMAQFATAEVLYGIEHDPPKINYEEVAIHSLYGRAVMKSDKPDVKTTQIQVVTPEGETVWEKTVKNGSPLTAIPYPFYRQRVARAGRQAARARAEQHHTDVTAFMQERSS